MKLTTSELDSAGLVYGFRKSTITTRLTRGGRITVVHQNAFGLQLALSAVFGISLLLLCALCVYGQPSDTSSEVPWRASQETALQQIERDAPRLFDWNRQIWEYAELGLQEHRSSRLLADVLEQAGFEVERGVSGMPTAFIASYGSGRPIIGLLAEYDALPGMSQKVVPYREPVRDGAPGHACGHSALGVAAVGAALAIKEALDKHQISGTIRLYGTPAEETVIGKVYMALDGRFDDLDVCLHWHPGDKNAAWASSSKALISAKFTFEGLPSHASVSPEAGRSALDAVELMNIGANYMREHVKEDARIHYVIVDGGGQPNVVPAKATVWYYVRADKHQDVEYLFEWLRDVAQGAALMTRTRVSIQIDTDCHEIIPNRPLAELLTRNLQRVGPPSFTEEERAFARRLQEPLEQQFGWHFAEPLDATVRQDSEGDLSKGSTDVGDISWRVPTGGLRTTCFVMGAPGHSWQNVATIASSIGQKGMLYAAKTLAVSALDLLEEPHWIAAARQDWKQRMEGRTYRSLIPPGQRPPQSIR